MPGAACPYLVGCQLIDVDGGNCALYGAVQFGCGAENEIEVDAHYDGFDSARGQACLDALALATDCHAATAASLAATCANLLTPAVNVGGTCITDANCIPPSPGTPPGLFFGCDTEDGFNGVGCGYTCSYGHALGTVCGSGLNGSGCTEGSCFQVAFTDAGYGNRCVAPPGDGGACNAGNPCADSNEFCEPASGICTPRSAPGGSCNYDSCLQNTGCGCDLSSVCTPADDGGGLCVTASDGGNCTVGDCYPSADDGCACLLLPGSYCQLPTDGGATGACQPQGGPGVACDMDSCSSGDVQCACQDGLICLANAPDGGSLCSPRLGQGGFCYPGRCFDPNDSECTCDPAQNLYCDTTNACLPQVTDGGACQQGQVNQCASGLTCAAGACIDSAPSTVGAPCAPNTGVACQGGLTCSDFRSGQCVVPSELGAPCVPNAELPCQLPFECTTALTDAGSICGQPPLAGEPCYEWDGLPECAGLLTCAYEPNDAGSYSPFCRPLSGMGGPCELGNPNTCIQGFCDPGSSTCQPLASLGESCNPAAATPCSELAGCYTDDDGGATCLSQCPNAG